MRRLRLLAAVCLLLPLAAPARDWKVRDVESLRRAVQDARPGDRILLRTPYRMTMRRGSTLTGKVPEGTFYGPKVCLINK